MQRRLAAILAADVVGYSRLVEVEEEWTITALKERRKAVIEPAVAKHGGQIVKYTGDGALVEFASAVSAVACAITIQAGMAVANDALPHDRRLELRIGIDLGEIAYDEADVFGQGVNIAARLEALAEPGGIWVSSKVHDEAAGRLEARFQALGEQHLKNISQPIRAYRVGDGQVALLSRASVPPAVPSRPSIAVLPFQNMSGDNEQEYFADGMVEEIITALSRFTGLFVIARNSSFVYRGPAVDIRRVGRELGVRYVLEGSVRRAGSRLRITGQLVEASTGAHLWADRFEGDLADVFALQDQITSQVVASIAPKVEEAEIERVLRKQTENLEAYDHYLRGMSCFHRWSRECNGEALSHFYSAFEMDPAFATAYGMAARTYVQRSSGGWMQDREHEVAETERMAVKAIEHGRDDALALATAGFAYSDVLGRVEDGDGLIERALRRNPNLAWAWLYSGWVKLALGDPELAIERISQAARLSPVDPHRFSFDAAAAMAHLFASRFAEALALSQSCIRDRPGFLLYNLIAMSAAALCGNDELARDLLRQTLRFHPALRLADTNLLPTRRAEHAALWESGLRRAGVPSS
jgi:adenylate cyclase